MNDSAYERISKSIEALKINAYASDLAGFIDGQELSPEQIEAIANVFEHLHEQKDETIRHTLLKMSRLPLKEPKTFEGFDFTILKSKQVDTLKNLPALTAIYAKRNLAFIGHNVFNKECTRLFFDVIDRRYNKEGPNTIIFTSNIGPDKWGEYFGEDSTLLGALDRIFDNATVYMMKGERYRGRGLETISVETGRIRPGVTTQ